MKYVLIIILLIFCSLVFYFYKKAIKNKKNTMDTNRKNKIDLTNREKQIDNKLIKVEQLSLDAIKNYELLSEIKDTKVLAHVNNLIPGLAQVATSANNAIQASSNIVYQAIIPAGTTLTKSSTMNNAVRGLYHGSNGIQGHANFIPVNNSNQAIVNTVSAGVSITSMIVGQYYMTQINTELTKINDEISKISNFQNSEYKSKILALLIQIKRISTFQTEIIEDKQLRELDIDKLNTLEQSCIELLGQANLTIKELIKKDSIDYKKYNQTLIELQNWTNYQKVLLKILYKITELKKILYIGTISDEQLNIILNTYAKQVVDVNNSLISWHESVARELGIDIEASRRKRKGIDGAIHWIPGLFNDEFNFSTLSEETKTMIEEQTLNYDYNTANDITEKFNKDIKIISKGGKIYYLPE